MKITKSGWSIKVTSSRIGRWEIRGCKNGFVSVRACQDPKDRPLKAPADFSPQSLQLSLHRVQFGTGNADQFGCFGSHAAPSARRFRPKPKSMRPKSREGALHNPPRLP